MTWDLKGYPGPMTTTQKNVKFRLDCAVACSAWLRSFPGHRVRHLVSSQPDHCPIHVSFEENIAMASVSRCHRYEVHWEREASLQEEIEAAWNHQPVAMNLSDITRKLDSTMDSLQLEQTLHWLHPKRGERRRSNQHVE
jgi:hypothetical protein